MSVCILPFSFILISKIVSFRSAFVSQQTAETGSEGAARKWGRPELRRQNDNQYDTIASRLLFWLQIKSF